MAGLLSRVHCALYVLGVLTCLACLTCLRAWRAPWNGALQKIGVLDVLHKMACLAYYIKWRAWQAWNWWNVSLMCLTSEHWWTVDSAELRKSYEIKDEYELMYLMKRRKLVYAQVFNGRQKLLKLSLKTFFSCGFLRVSFLFTLTYIFGVKKYTLFNMFLSQKWHAIWQEESVGGYEGRQGMNFLYVVSLT